MSTLASELALRYVVDDLPGAGVPCSRIQNILDAFSHGRSLSVGGEEFLRSRELFALIALAKGEMDADAFRSSALTEQQSRLLKTEKERQLRIKQAAVEAAEIEARRRVMLAGLEAARLREARDPRNIAKRRNGRLREKFLVDCYVDEDAYPRLMSILEVLDVAQRLSESDVEWLASVGREYRTPTMMHAYHRSESDHYVQEFKDTGNIWCAVSASGHLRKCNASTEAHDLLSAIPERSLKPAKLKAAVFTTHGGALRDLAHHEDAKHFAMQAHTLLDADYRPCTLLGAIHIEMGEIAQGHEWYCEAEARGAPSGHIDGELRTILRRLPKARRIAIINELIATDASRYEWMRKEFGK